MIKIVFENRETFRNKFGKDVLDKYLAIRDKIADTKWKDMDEVCKTKTKEEVEDYINNFQSNTQKKKNAREKGSEKVYSDDTWDVIKVYTYPAMAQIGYGTKWCIAGNYEGAEEKGQYYFDNYLKKMAVDYYMVYINKETKKKYCVLKQKGLYGNMLFYYVYNPQDNEIGFVPCGPIIEGFEGAVKDYDSEGIIEAINSKAPELLPEEVFENPSKVQLSKDERTLLIQNAETGETYFSVDCITVPEACEEVRQSEIDNAAEISADYFESNELYIYDVRAILSCFSGGSKSLLLGEKKQEFISVLCEDYLDWVGYEKKEEIEALYVRLVNETESIDEICYAFAELPEGREFDTRGVISFLLDDFPDDMARVYLDCYSSVMDCDEYELISEFKSMCYENDVIETEDILILLPE